MQLWNWRGIDVINAHERDLRVTIGGVEEAVRRTGEGSLIPEPLFTHTFPLSRLGEALEHTGERPPGFMKALVTMG